MKDFLTNIKLSDKESSELAKSARIKSYSKGDSILKLNHINKDLYFINEGLVKLSFFKEDKEFILRFFREGEFCAALDSFVTQKPSNYYITAIEDTNLIAIDYSELNNLSNRHHSIEKIFTKITSMATVNMMNRISEMLETNGKERYAKFLEENKHLINRISLGDLSGYLGISQVSLSRIRSKM